MRLFDFKYFLVLAVSAIILNSQNIRANNPTDAEIKAALIYNFIRYIEFAGFVSNDSIVLGFYGQDEVLKSKLLSLNGKAIKERIINVSEIKKVNEVPPLDLLFVFYENNDDVNKFYRSIKGTSTLLITDRYEEKREVMINFIYSEDNKVQFEVNSKNIKSANLEISPKLLLLGGTELDIRELYKSTEQSLINERERAEQIENELSQKKREVEGLNMRLHKMKVEVDTLNSIIISNIYTVQLQEKLLDSMHIAQAALSKLALDSKKALDSVNTIMLSKNQEISALDIQLSEKQQFIEFAADSLISLQDEIKDQQLVLAEQNLVLREKEKQVRLQRTAIFLIVCFAVVLAAFLGFIFRNNKINKAKNIELERRNHKINLQKEQIQAQAEVMRETNIELEKLSIVAEKTENAVIIMDNQGNMEWVNNGFERMFGYPFKEFKERSGHNFISASSNKRPREILRACIVDKKPVSYDSEFVTKDSVVKWLRTNITPIMDDVGNVLKLVAIDTDITKLKEADSKIRKKNRKIEEDSKKLKLQATELRTANQELEATLMKLKSAQTQLVATEKMASLGQLTSGIAHEINNPINYISSSIEGLRSIIDDVKVMLDQYDRLDLEKAFPEITRIKEEVDYHETLEGFEELTSNIKMGVDRTKEIVNSLRTFSRIDEDLYSLINVNECIDSAVILLGNAHKDRIQIVKNYQELPLIEGILGKVNQVFLNVLVNAIQAIEGNGHINLSTRLINKNEKEYVEVVFKDDGIGMNAETKRKVFEPFFTTKEVGTGTGLGLSITYSIINSHDGTIEIDSKLGKGTSFIICLPVKRT